LGQQNVFGHREEQQHTIQTKPSAP
jgi:hypothetical protein